MMKNMAHNLPVQPCLIHLQYLPEELMYYLSLQALQMLQHTFQRLQVQLHFVHFLHKAPERQALSIELLPYQLLQLLRLDPEPR